MITTIIVWIIIILLFIAGIAGTFLPIVPGTPLILLGAIIYGYYTDFKEVTLTVIVILLILALIVQIVDFVASAYGTRKSGASKLSSALTIVGAVIGIFVGIWGIVILPLIGAVVGELISGKNLQSALKSGFAAFLGFLGGTFLKFTVAIIMIGIFIIVVI